MSASLADQRIDILIDANVLLRLRQPGRPERSIVHTALQKLGERSYRIIVVPQVIYEYWVVSTRPTNVRGLGLAVSDAQRDIEGFKRLYELLDDDAGVFHYWEPLVIASGVSGKQAHDARLVAAMQRHLIPEIMTFNVNDLTRYPGIVVRSPQDVASWPELQH
ncbi:MAG: type II toxin-antitoxin system VapC family toxin [Planctomycetia bacterium]|nr:type II toxin-antitoxin system VapC family toxin [Planctomycetia bacterium]